MIVYQTVYEGFFVGVVNADPDPLEQGKWLIPGGCVEVAPPDLLVGQSAKWSKGRWTIVDPEPEPAPEPEPEPPTPEELAAIAQTNRQAAFQSEADPLFFKWQAGEGTEAEWLAKREEIRNRFPYPSDAPN
jgi:hypothetical protein